MLAVYAEKRPGAAGSVGRPMNTQREFQGRLRTAGGVYVLARSLEDVQSALSGNPGHP
jgi:hypothetical protein